MEEKDVYLDFKGEEIKIPKMCCSNFKKYEQYNLKVEDNETYIEGINILDNQTEEYETIQALKEIVDIGEFIYRLQRKKINNNCYEILDNYIEDVSTKIIKWCKKYGLLYGEGINHDKSKVHIHTFINYSLNLCKKLKIWTFITSVNNSDSEKLEYANLILKSKYNNLEEVRYAIFPQDVKNDVINSELFFSPINYQHIYSCQSITNVLELQFLFLCTSEIGVKNSYDQLVRILECKNCHNFYATFNARIKYCKYCNEPTARATARQQKHRRKK